MTLEDLRDTMIMTIEATAERMVIDLEELINTMILAGASASVIQATLAADLKTSGRIFGAFKNKSKSIVANAIENTSSISAIEAMEEAGINRWMWVASGTNICPDCEDRAGRTGTTEFFDLIGHPKSGFSVCREHCNCTLVPIEYDKEGIQFIKVGKEKFLGE